MIFSLKFVDGFLLIDFILSFFQLLLHNSLPVSLLTFYCNHIYYINHKTIFASIFLNIYKINSNTSSRFKAAKRVWIDIQKVCWTNKNDNKQRRQIVIFKRFSRNIRDSGRNELNVKHRNDNHNNNNYFVHKMFSH